MLRAHLRWSALAILLTSATPALAQRGGSTVTQEVARTKGEEGLAAYGNKQWQQAYDAFKVAESLFHAPTLVLYMARCQANLGKLLEARAFYEKIAVETIPKNATPAFRDAIKTAQSELEALRPRIPSIEIVVTGVAADAAHVTIDGATVPPDDVSKKRDLDPGAHTISATADNARPLTRTVTLAEGAAVKVELPFEIGTTGPAAPTAAPAPSAPATPADRPGSMIPGIIALGVGAAGLGVGAVTGVMTLGKASDVTANCDGTHCLTADQEKADSARLLGTISTIAFIAGGVCVAGGAVLLVLRPGGGPATETQSAWRASIGVGRVDFGGTF
jgi:hypothetical protein